MSYESNKLNFIALAKELAPYFPDYELTIQEDHYCGAAYFAFKADKSKNLFFLVDDDKFTVSPGIYKKPHHSFDVYVGNDKLNPPRVGFSINRPAEQIAKGIKTRFMPEFEEYFRLCCEKWQSIEDHANDKAAVIKEFAEILGVKDIQNHVRGGIRENLRTYESPNKNLKEFISDVRVSSADSIEIKTNCLTKEQPIKLFEFIKGL